MSTETWTWEGDSLRSPTGDYFDLDAKGFKEYVAEQLNHARAGASADALAIAVKALKYLARSEPNNYSGYRCTEALSRIESASRHDRGLPSSCGRRARRYQNDDRDDSGG